MSLSVIIPAYNEEFYIAHTLRAIWAARDYLQARAECAVEVLVIDNHSTDNTACVASNLGAVVLSASRRNIAHVRNQGAKAAIGKVLVFIDADTWVPEPILLRIHQLTSNQQCLGGAAETLYTPKRKSVALYLSIWRVAGKIAHLAQGALQFCQKEAFFAVHGYNESLFMGEDVNFFSRLRRYAKRVQSSVTYIVDLPVKPSTRRFDHWPLWRTLLFTNPLFISLFSRVPRAWGGWYGDVPR